MILRGRVDGPADASFAQHTVLAAYRVPLPGDGRDGGANVTVPQQASAPVAADGSFQLELDDRAVAPVGLVLLSPAGGRLATTELSGRQLSQEVELRAEPFEPFAIRPGDGPTAGQTVRLTGRVIDEGGRDVPADLPVVLWGVGGPGADAETPRPLVITSTQVSGYFAADWPADELDSAYGAVAGAGHVAIPLTDGRLPTRVLLVCDLSALPETAEGGDCACESGATPPRVPSSADLTANPAAYSQDLGGGCVDLTTPNRVLEEFTYSMVVRTTDPQVRGVTLPSQRALPSQAQRLLLEVLRTSPLPLLAGGAQAAGEGNDGGELVLRTAMTEPAGAGAKSRARATPADKGGTQISVAAAMAALRDPEKLDTETLQHAILADRTGALLSLIDGLRQRTPERTALDGADPVDWDDTPTIHEATTVAHGHLLQFRQVWRADGYSLGDLQYSLPLAPGQKREVAVLDWERRTSAAREESLDEEEQLDALVSRDRDISEIAGSRLTEDTRGGSDSSTWGVAGGIGAGFIGSGFGIFGGVGGGASGASSNAWQSSARNFSANALQQLSDRTSQRASSVRDQRSTVVQTVAQGETVSAETEVVANHNHCHALTVEYFEVLRHFLVTHELADVRECLFVPLPMTPFDQAKALRWREPLQRFLRDSSLARGFDALERIARNWDGYDYPEHRYSEEPPEVLEGELRISFLLPRPRDDDDGKFQVDEWKWLSPLLDTTPLALWTAELAAREQADRDRYFLTQVAPGVAQRLVQRLEIGFVTRDGVVVPVDLDATLVSRYSESVPLYVSLRPAGALPSVAREDISRLRIAYEGADLPPDARVIVHSGKVRYSTEHLTHLLFDEPRILNDLRPGDPVVVATPLDRAELRDPRAEDRQLADKLVAHLNEQLEYYHQAIWVSMDPNRRYMLLDGAIAPNSGGRSVASVVENRMIGIVGNCLVMPVAPGNHLDPTLQDQKGRATLMDAYASDAPPPIRISVPTRGVYAEAVMGACDSCEKKDDTRFWRWEESPIPDQPAPIQPLSTDSRAAADGAPPPTPLPQPLVAIQNAPELPDPVGLQQAFALLGRSDVFRDDTGLAGTQRNAMAAFQSALDTAKFFGGEASRLAQQQSSSRNVDRQLAQITQARDAGLLTSDQAQQAAHAALRTLVGEPPAGDQPPTSHPAVQQAIDAAAQSGSGQVTVDTPQEAVTATFSDGGLVGAASVPRSEDRQEWVSVPMTQDELSGPPAGPFTYTVPAGTRDLAAFQTAFEFENLGPAGVGRMAQGLMGRVMRADPADATKFQPLMRLHVTWPADPAHPDQIAGTSRLPVAVLVHGNHIAWDVQYAAAASGTVTIGGVAVDVHDPTGVTETPNHLGYTYLQDELARQGIVSVSVDTNFANFTDSLIETRADMILEALRIMRRLDADPASRYHGRLDLSKVGLMGHSRGGDAVVRAAKKNLAAPAADRFGIRTVCSLAPTDFAGGVAPASRPFLDANDLQMYTVVYGSLDGDVSGVGGANGAVGTGFRHYDRARCPKAMAFLRNCNHNRFNRTWSVDEGGVTPAQAGLLRSRADHEQLAVDYVGGLMRWQLKGETAKAALFDRDAANSLGADVSMQFAFGSQLLHVDDFENPFGNNLGGARTVGVGAIEDYQTLVTAGGTSLAPNVPHQTHVLDVNMVGPLVGSALDTGVPSGGPRDWTGYAWLLLSVAAAYDVTSDATIAAAHLPDAVVTLRDAGGHAASVPMSAFLDQPTRPWFHEVRTSGGTRNATALRLETLRVPLSAFAGVDLAHVDRVSLETVAMLSVEVFYDSIKLMKA